MRTFCEFFAGGGMVRAGLGRGWRCLLANDFDSKKAQNYKRNWGGLNFVEDDVRNIEPHLPNQAPDLVWASFPCQDLSLAGGGAGLKGDRSGTFWPFWRHMKVLANTNRAPTIITLENVTGTLSSHDGRDFTSIVTSFADLGYRVGAMVIDAKLFVPQSRPRLFIIGVNDPRAIRNPLASESANEIWSNPALVRAHERLPIDLKAAWVWWQMRAPSRRVPHLSELIEENPADVDWHSPSETQDYLNMMSDINFAKVEKARATGNKIVGTLYRRTRPSRDGSRAQRAEVRFDGYSGCLRTPAGGSSRQVILVVERDKVRSRLISARETARLMGLSDSYALPERYNDAYHLTGDGVVVDVVAHICENLFVPMLDLIGDAQYEGVGRAA